MGTDGRSVASKHTCEFCSHTFVVESLARDCEMRHIEEEE